MLLKSMHTLQGKLNHNTLGYVAALEGPLGLEELKCQACIYLWVMLLLSKHCG